MLTLSQQWRNLPVANCVTVVQRVNTAKFPKRPFQLQALKHGFFIISDPLLWYHKSTSANVEVLFVLTLRNNILNLFIARGPDLIYKGPMPLERRHNCGNLSPKMFGSLVGAIRLFSAIIVHTIWSQESLLYDICQ